MTVNIILMIGVQNYSVSVNFDSLKTSPYHKPAPLGVEHMPSSQITQDDASSEHTATPIASELILTCAMYLASAFATTGSCAA